MLWYFSCFQPALMIWLRLCPTRTPIFRLLITWPVRSLLFMCLSNTRIAYIWPCGRVRASVQYPLRGWCLVCPSCPRRPVIVLTHCGRVTHICVSKLTIIGSDNGSSPGRRQAIIWTNDQCWNIVNWTLGNKFQWNLNRKLYIFLQENAF